MAPATSSKRQTYFKLPHFGKSKKTCEQNQTEITADIRKFATEPESALTKRNREQSPLLRLPGEIRNPIYEYVLGGHHVRSTDGYIYITKDSLRYMENPPENFSQLANLEQVCGQLRNETKLQTYAPNNIYFSTPQQLMSWSRNPSPDAKAKARWDQFETFFWADNQYFLDNYNISTDMFYLELRLL